MARCLAGSRYSQRPANATDIRLPHGTPVQDGREGAGAGVRMQWNPGGRMVALVGELLPNVVTATCGNVSVFCLFELAF